MKKILIPTDFSGKSLDVLTDFLLFTNEKTVSVLFFNGMTVSDSITDLLLLPRRAKEMELIPKYFDNYCKCLRKEFDRLTEVRFDYFYGNTAILFRNFLNANDIDEIVFDPTVDLRRLNKDSLNMIEMINRCKWGKWSPSQNKTRSLITDTERKMITDELEKVFS